MTTTYLTVSQYFHMNLVDRYPGRELFCRLVLDHLPERELPVILHYASTGARIHPGHLLIPGRDQFTSIPPYTFLPHNRLDATPVTCWPQTGEIWANPTFYRALKYYGLYQRACATNRLEDWDTLYLSANRYQGFPPQYPILWTPVLAARQAKPGSTIELIHFSLNLRFYAVLTELVALGTPHGLFRARLLGTRNYGTDLAIMSILHIC